MKIFNISPVVERYKGLVSNERKPISNERFKQILFVDGISKSNSWTHLSLRWIVGANTELVDKDTYDQDYAIPDIAYWAPGCLVINPKATEILKPNFKSEADFLPVSVEDEKGWTILNVTNMQDILDKTNCRYHVHSDGTVGKRIIKAAFFRDQITNGKLFRVTGLKPFLYTSDMPGSFKEVVESNSLTGLEFAEKQTN